MTTTATPSKHMYTLPFHTQLLIPEGLQLVISTCTLQFVVRYKHNTNFANAYLVQVASTGLNRRSVNKFSNGYLDSVIAPSQLAI